MLWLVVVALAISTALYAGAKAAGDLRGRRWGSALLGLCVATATPLALSIMAQLMYDYRDDHSP
jgi:hypothetical protein